MFRSCPRAGPGKILLVIAAQRMPLDQGLRAFRIQAFAMVRYAMTFPWLHRGRVGLRSLADHAIVNYTAGIERAIARAEEQGAGA